VPRFYSPEWVAAFNEGVAGLDPSVVDTDASLVAAGGHFSVTQMIQGAPAPPDGTPGDLVATLAVDGGRLSLTLGDPVDGPADVTVSLSWADAGALSRGELDPAGALAAGRVRVHGDLSVLVAAQALLAAAAGRLDDLQAATTY
jgi:hypothetical protein